MSVIYIDDVIKRDTSICDRCKVYLGRGQGCDTIWFRSIAAARRAFDKDGIKTGHDLYDCTQCACHYSINDARQKKFKFHACADVKKEYADTFN